MIQRANLNGLKVATPDDLLAAAEASHPMALDILEKAGRLLGQTLANLATLFNPELIIISGEGIRMGDFMLRPMHDALRRHALPNFKK